MGKYEIIVPVGTFKLEREIVRVSDPCYPQSECEHAGLVFDCLLGTWAAAVKREDQGNWGKRNMVLAAHHAETADKVFAMKDFKYLNDFRADDKRYYVPPDWEKVNIEVGVDSGQAGIFEDTKYGRNDIFGGSPPAECDFGDEWYNHCCDQTSNTEHNAGCIPCGVISESGYGDGGYSAYCHRTADGNIDGIVIVFY